MKKANLELDLKQPKDQPNPRIDPDMGVSFETDDRFILVDTMPAFLDLCKAMEAAPLIAADTETSGLDPILDHVVGMSFCFDRNYSYYIPIRHILTNHKQLDWEEIQPHLQKVFSDPKKQVIFHNAKFDLRFFAHEKPPLTFKCKVEDTMFKAHLLDENRPKSLKHLAKGFFGDKADQWAKSLNEFFSKYARRFKIPKAKLTYDYIPIPMMTQYGAADTFFTFFLYDDLSQQLRESHQLVDLYEVEKYFMKALIQMEDTGMAVNVDYIKKAVEQCKKNMRKLQHKILDLLQENININSPKQLGDYFEKHNIRTGRLTPTNRIAVNQAALERIKDKHPFIPLLLEYRKIKKISSTYFESFLKTLLDEDGNLRGDGRIHCNFMQTGTVTGRVASKDPNLHNIPRENEEGLNVRKAFICPDKDHFMFLIDLSQIELRMTAHYSQDPILLESYRTGEDVHTRTAAEVFNVSKEEVVKSQRDKGKTLNFALIYGAGPARLAETMKVSEEEAKYLQDLYFAKYRGVKAFIDYSQRQALNQGWMVNYYGRVRRLPKVFDTPKDHPRYWFLMSQMAREGTNFLIQGTCADLFKLSVCRMYRLLEQKKAKSRLISNIHDEVIFYIYKDEIYLIPEIKACMENFPEFSVPILAEGQYSFTNWADKKGLRIPEDLDMLKQHFAN